MIHRLTAAFLLTVAPAIAGPAGTWTDVTPAAMKMAGDFIDGPICVNVDPVRPSDVYVQAQYDGCWKSTDYGATWKKISTGAGADEMNGGRQWYAAIDMNPKRDPATPPTLYTILGYGAGGVWKSTDGGVDWFQTWNKFFRADGVTRIDAGLVGSDVSGVMICDSTDPDHLIAFPHGNIDSSVNGVYSSNDGGGSWILHKADAFAFAPHADVAFPFDKTTWFVSHGTVWPNTVMYRTTDAGATWSPSGELNGMSVGRAYWVSGDTIYAGSDFWSGVFKSTDKGATWSKLPCPGNEVSWVVLTKTKAYASSGRDNPHIYSAKLSDESVWTDEGNPSGMAHGGSRAAVTFDGTNYVIVAGQESGGLWRYVEPVPSMAIRKNPSGHPSRTRVSKTLEILEPDRPAGPPGTVPLDVRGRRMGDGRPARQAAVTR